MTVLQAGRSTEQSSDIVANAKHQLGEGAPDEAYLSHWCQAVQMALCAALARDGWTLSAPVGKPVSAARDGKTIEPFLLFDDLLDQKITLEEFESVCRSARVADVRLSIPDT
jgi:hypothetical protein